MTPLLGQSRRSRPLSETDTMVNRGNEPSCGNRGLVGFPPAYLLTIILPQDPEVIKSSLLRTRGDRVTIISRYTGEDRIIWDDVKNNGLPQCDAVINLAGKHILDPKRRWNESYREEVIASKVVTTKEWKFITLSFWRSHFSSD